MADSNSPFKRVGANSWEELLDKVNEELQNPPEDTSCEPIDPIETPAECHRWAKSDIQEVHDKLDQMPTDCFTFQGIPDLWKVSIIEDIENQLANSWCDCEDDEICCKPCPNCGINTVEFLFEFDTNAACVAIGAENAACVTNCEQLQLSPIVNNYFDARNRYKTGACDFCKFCDELDVLQSELDALNTQLTALEAVFNACPPGGEGTACRSAAQAAIDAKQAAIDAKQGEVDAKQDEKDTAESDRDSAKVDVLSFGNAAFAVGGSCILGPYPSCNNLAGSSGPIPRSDGNCTELPDPCCLCDPLSCQTTFIIDRRTTRLGNFNFVGSFNFVGTGQYNIDGSPIWTNWNGDCCFQPQYTCASSNCANGGCSSCNCNYLYAYQRRTLTQSCFSEFDCINGGPCDGVG